MGGLAEGQRERLAAVGVIPRAVPEPEAPAKPSTAPVNAFEWGVSALEQYKARTGSVTVPRAHVEVLPDGAEASWVSSCPTPRPAARSSLPTSSGPWPPSACHGAPDIARQPFTTPRARSHANRRRPAKPQSHSPTAVNSPRPRPVSPSLPAHWGKSVQSPPAGRVVICNNGQPPAAYTPPQCPLQVPPEFPRQVPPRRCCGRARRRRLRRCRGGVRRCGRGRWREAAEQWVSGGKG